MGGRMGRRKRFSGQETVAAVEAALKSDGGSQKAAFERVAKETGRSPNSIAVTFYRLKAKGGGVSSGRIGRRPRRGGRPRRDTTLSKAIVALEIVGSVLKQQQAELERLVRRNTQLQEIRKLLA